MYELLLQAINLLDKLCETFFSEPRKAHVNLFSKHFLKIEFLDKYGPIYNKFIFIRVRFHWGGDERSGEWRVTSRILAFLSRLVLYLQLLCFGFLNFEGRYS